MKYLPPNKKLAADIEFLCPESGLPREQGRSRVASSSAVQTGLLAQPLRYLELLSYRPWEIELARIPEFGMLQDVRIRVPNPAAYVMQKILIRKQRRVPQSAAKDCYYIYEVSVIFRDSLGVIEDESAALKKAYGTWFKTFLKEVGSLFARPNAEGPVSALRVFCETRAALGFKSEDLTEEAIFRTVSKLLKAMH